MKKSISSGQTSFVMELLAGILLAVVGLFFFSGSFKVLTVLAGVAVIVFLIKGDGSALRHPVTLLLLAYVLVAGLSGIWALSGKFFLREYAKIFVAACLFVAVLLIKNFEKKTVRTLLSGMSVISAVYSFLSVEYVTTGISKLLLQLAIPGMVSTDVGVESGIRLTGIFGSPNPTSTILAFSIFFGICLICTEEKKGMRRYYAAVLALNAYTFLMLFSMAGTGLFALSLLVYLAAAGKKRAAVFVRMLIGALPTLAWVFVAFSFLTAEGALKVIPLAAMLANVVTVVFLETAVSEKLIPVLEKRAKLALISILALIVLAVVYVVVAMNVGSAYTFGDGFRRSIYPEPGAHTLTIQADGNVTYNIISQNEAETIMHTSTHLGGGSDKEITFHVPEGSKVCYIDFSAEPGVTLEQVLLDGTTQVNLEYPLLPAFIANRMQGLWANQNVIQRTAFFDDGMKLFYQRPLQGNGVGSFETGVTSVQEFYYETKYIHNHYIQVLEECGILGFIPFVGALAGLVFLLWKKRKEEEWVYQDEHAALCAAVFMTLTHIAFEVSMSNAIFLCFAFVTFGVIIRCCTQKPVEAAVSKKKGSVATKAPAVFNWAAAALSFVFVVTLFGNLFASYLLSAPVHSEEKFMENLSLAAQVDPYEKNDAKLSYVVAAANSQNREYYLTQADEYAAQLEKVQSNTIPKVLVQYYLSTMQPKKAVDAASASAAYSASDAATWNDTISIFRGVLLNPIYLPLYINEPELSASLMGYYDTLRQHNAESMEDIALDISSKDFFGKQLSLMETEADLNTMLKVLNGELFRSATACDANSDLIPDQVSWYNGVTFQENGVMEFVQSGQLNLDLYCQTLDGTAQVKVYCSDPYAVSLSCISNQQVIPAVVENGCAVFEVPAEYQQDSTLSVQITSTTAQQVTTLDVAYAA